MLNPVKVWRQQKTVQKHLGKVGTILSFTLVRAAPSGFVGEAPYPVVIVAISNKERLIGQLVDWEDENLRIGQKVVAVIRRIRSAGSEGIIPYGIKFRPIMTSQRSKIKNPKS